MPNRGLNNASHPNLRMPTSGTPVAGSHPNLAAMVTTANTSHPNMAMQQMALHQQQQRAAAGIYSPNATFGMPPVSPASTGGAAPQEMAQQRQLLLQHLLQQQQQQHQTQRHQQHPHLMQQQQQHKMMRPSSSSGNPTMNNAMRSSMSNSSAAAAAAAAAAAGLHLPLQSPPDHRSHHGRPPGHHPHPAMPSALQRGQSLDIPKPIPLQPLQSRVGPSVPAAVRNSNSSGSNNSSNNKRISKDPMSSPFMVPALPSPSGNKAALRHSSGAPIPSHQQISQPKQELQVSMVATATAAPPPAPPPAPPVIPSRPPMTSEEAEKLLKSCDWVDQTIWVARQVFGGTSVNGFMKATAAAQRIKKQRARQTGFKVDKDDKDEQAQEEALKKDVLNPRTAKKIRGELVQGLKWCQSLHETIRGIIGELDPSVTIPKLEVGGPRTSAALLHGGEMHPMASSSSTQSSSSMPQSSKSSKSSISQNPQRSQSLPVIAPKPKNNKQSSSSASTSTSSAGDPSGSVLRKSRSKKLALQAPPLPSGLSELDESRKRIYTKKEHAWRIFEVLRFRNLIESDYVAAQVSSRDLFILAQVDKKYPSCGLNPTEFLKLTPAKRDLLFRNQKVTIKDVEDNDVYQVDRNKVLPLPRSFAEAADWASRLRKGSRVYAMYPNSTSLYSATVLDSTTYCRGDDDIIVVEFDDDDVDPTTGALNTYHIPARFVTLIPRDFPASNGGSGGSGASGSANASNANKSSSLSSGGGGGSKKNKSSSNNDGPPFKKTKRPSQKTSISNKSRTSSTNQNQQRDEEALNAVIDDMDLNFDGGLDSLSFDLGLT